MRRAVAGPASRVVAVLAIVVIGLTQASGGGAGGRRRRAVRPRPGAGRSLEGRTGPAGRAARRRRRLLDGGPRRSARGCASCAAIRSWSTSGASWCGPCRAGVPVLPAARAPSTASASRSSASTASDTPGRRSGSCASSRSPTRPTATTTRRSPRAIGIPANYPITLFLDARASRPSSTRASTDRRRAAGRHRALPACLSCASTRSRACARSWTAEHVADARRPLHGARRPRIRQTPVSRRASRLAGAMRRARRPVRPRAHGGRGRPAPCSRWTSCPPRSRASGSASAPTPCGRWAATCSATSSRRRSAAASASSPSTTRPSSSRPTPRAARVSCCSRRARPRRASRTTGRAAPRCCTTLDARAPRRAPLKPGSAPRPRGAEHFCWRIDVVPAPRRRPARSAAPAWHL